MLLLFSFKQLSIKPCRAAGSNGKSFFFSHWRFQSASQMEFGSWPKRQHSSKWQLREMPSSCVMLTPFYPYHFLEVLSPICCHTASMLIGEKGRTPEVSLCLILGYFCCCCCCCSRWPVRLNILAYICKMPSTWDHPIFDILDPALQETQRREEAI